MVRVAELERADVGEVRESERREQKGVQSVDLVRQLFARLQLRSLDSRTGKQEVQRGTPDEPYQVRDCGVTRGERSAFPECVDLRLEP